MYQISPPCIRPWDGDNHYYYTISYKLGDNHYDCIISYKLGECIALCGERERGSVVGVYRSTPTRNELSLKCMRSQS